MAQEPDVNVDAGRPEKPTDEVTIVIVGGQRLHVHYPVVNGVRTGSTVSNLL